MWTREGKFRRWLRSGVRSSSREFTPQLPVLENLTACPLSACSDVTIPSGHPIMMSYAQQTHQRRGEEEEDEVEREGMEQSLM